jgi:hypothetical protein
MSAIAAKAQNKCLSEKRLAAGARVAWIIFNTVPNSWITSSWHVIFTGDEALVCAAEYMAPGDLQIEMG